MNPLKSLERYITAIFKLGRTERLAKTANKRVDATEQRLDRLEDALRERDQHLRERDQHLGEISEALEALRAANESRKTEYSLLLRVFGDMTRRVDNLADRHTTRGVGQRSSSTGLELAQSMPDLTSEGFLIFKDNFYHRLENRYRGSLEDISKRVSIYLPDIEAAYLRTNNKPVADLGCGRGEWLSLLRDAGISSFGIDLNEVQMAEAREQNLDVRTGDAVASLAQMEDASLSAITAHHFIEHISFDTVAWITREAMRVLAPGGILLFETPHVGNVLVGATTFHTDPTHIKPIPEQVLKTLFETAGYDPVESRLLNPHERLDEFINRSGFDPELAHLLFGPQDLVVIGQKPQEMK